MTWIGNVPQSEAETFINEMKAYNPGAEYRIKTPEASGVYTSQQLAEQGYVGIYRL